MKAFTLEVPQNMNWLNLAHLILFLKILFFSTYCHLKKQKIRLCCHIDTFDVNIYIWWYLKDLKLDTFIYI